MRYYLGLDNGGTTTKAALYDKNGRELGVASVSTHMLTPGPGFAERDMEEMWQANCAVLRGVLEKTGVRPRDIAGVGVCGHGKGLYLWGKNNKPLGNGILSTDNRAYAYPLLWRKDGTEGKAFALSCQHVMACQPVALLAWLRDHEPERYRNIRWVFACKDYVRFRLTGEAKAERTDYSGAGLLNLHTKEYDPALLALFGLSDVYGALPPLCGAGEVCGCVTEEAAKDCGLLPGTPVIGGMFDVNACALAVGVAGPGRFCVIAGTWSINEYVCPAPVLDGTVRMNSLFCLPGYNLVEESSPTSAGNNEWFLRQLLPEFISAERAAGRDPFDALNAWVEAVPPEEFVPVFLPFLMASNVHPNAKGSFVGLGVHHTRGHLVRAVYEGIAFCHKTHIDRLLESCEKPPASVRLAGGMSHSPVWVQIFADVLQMPVETVRAGETGALGCAMAVAAAVGDFPSLPAAVEHMCAVSPAVLPDPGKAKIYEKKYRLYQKTIACLDGLWEDTQALIEQGDGR